MKDAFSTVAGIVKGAAEDAVRASRRILQAGAKGIRTIASRSSGASGRGEPPTGGARSPAAPSAPPTAAPDRSIQETANDPVDGAAPGPSGMSTASSKAAAAKKSRPAKKSTPAKKNAPAKKSAPAKKAAKAAPQTPTPDDAPADSGVGTDPQGRKP